MKEEIVKINVSDIADFPKHPFKINNDLNYEELKESIKENGILVPAIVRQKEDGSYEMISGHRRKKACEILGIEKIPAVVRELDDDQATIMMVDSNFQREKILPSEKAFAYKMKSEAMKHQGIACSPMEHKKTVEVIGESVGDSASQVQRYIRLTYLIPELLEFADNNELGLSPSIAFRPAVELSYLKEEEQYNLYDAIKYLEATPSLAQSQEFKRMSQSHGLSKDDIVDILSEEKANQIPTIKFNESRIRSVLPKNIQPDKIEDFVIKSIEFYSKHLKTRDENAR